ncbi:hypothetical protein [Amycolatopsis pigmentata]|uniref:Secreted protein n=1 Tax=Amycolatopsis pigmentata TaxID=450801 RepID=A0ABW5G3T5_9PSEU
MEDMLRGVKKLAKFSAILTTGVVGAIFLLPAGNAYAIDRVDCGRAGAVHISGHTVFGLITHSFEDCWVNHGTHSYAQPNDQDVYLEKVSTGDFSVSLHDCNSDQPTLNFGPSTVYTRPNNPMCLDHIDIN